jgi:lactoylglutathione lyase
MPEIEHAALWTPDLERARAFYEHYFDATAGEKYVNPEKDFSSYFLTFDSGARLELMHTPAMAAAREDAPAVGYAHIAVSVGSEQEVDALTERLREDGYTVCSSPRRTGDGYYESVVLDPDDNRVEMTI